MQDSPSLCKLATLTESMHVVGLNVHKPPPGPSLHIAEETRPGGIWKPWEEELDGRGHGLGSTFCLYTFMLMSKGWVSQQHPAICREKKKKRRFSLKALHFLSSFIPQNILFISFSETVSDVAGKEKKGFKRELRCILLCDTYE